MPKYPHDNAKPGLRIEALAPSGKFVLDQPSSHPVVLLSVWKGSYSNDHHYGAPCGRMRALRLITEYLEGAGHKADLEGPLFRPVLLISFMLHSTPFIF